MKLINLDYQKYLEELSSNSPAPGGGSVSAISGGLGVSLFQMVVNLSINKKGYEEYRESYERLMEESKAYQEFFIRAVDDDSDAFNDVIKAFRMPKETEEDKEARRKAIQAGYKHAADVPFEVGKKAYDFYGFLEDIVDKCNENSITDIAVSGLQLRAALYGDFYNVRINLFAIKDEDYVKSRLEEMEKMEEDLVRREKELMEKINKIME